MTLLWIILVLVCVLVFVCVFMAYKIGKCFERIELDFNEEEEKP